MSDWPPIADPVARIVVLFRGGTTIRALTDMFGLPDQVVEGIIRMAARLAQAEQRIIELEDGVEDRVREERERIADTISAACDPVIAEYRRERTTYLEGQTDAYDHAERITRGGGVR